MNCLEFRHHLLINPQQTPAEFAEHRLNCPACARAAKQAGLFEHSLHNAVIVDLPEGLEARIMLTCALDSPQRHPRWHRRLALAASLLLVVSISGGLLYLSKPIAQHDTLQAAVFGHINAELDHLLEDHDLRAKQLTGLFDQFGARVEDGIGKVNYAGRCTIRRHAGLHLVLPGQHGPIT
ncbi:MAG: DUF3379 family protein, partial [Gammaproteobacteria bacterium]|nr:DUF3379 family protein [Gammaproteobacteria bacterium]